MSSAKSTLRWRHAWDRFEAIVGLIAVFMLSFGPPTVAGLGGLISLLTGEWPAAAACALIVSVTGPMAVWLAQMCGAAVEKFLAKPPKEMSRLVVPENMKGTASGQQVPFALLMVGELPRLPLIARFPLAIWWFSHFAAASAIVLVNTLPVRQRMQGQGVVESLLMLLLCLLFTFAANVFLMLAVSVAFWSPAVTARVWRYRFLIDLLLITPALLGVAF
jgi:hypothetical protein